MQAHHMTGTIGFGLSATLDHHSRLDLVGLLSRLMHHGRLPEARCGPRMQALGAEGMLIGAACGIVNSLARSPTIEGRT